MKMIAAHSEAIETWGKHLCVYVSEYGIYVSESGIPTNIDVLKNFAILTGKHRWNLF